MPRLFYLGFILFTLACSPKIQMASSENNPVIASITDFNSNRVSEVAIMLRWTPIKEDIVNYTIYRQEKEGWTRIASLSKSDTRFLDTGLNPNQDTYEYYIEVYTMDYDSHALKLTSEATNKNTSSYKYIVNEPKGYNPDTDQLHPLLIFLHGAGERGDNLDMVRMHGPPKLYKEGMDFPAIIVSPLCPVDVYWETQKLEALLQEIKKKYNVDDSRIYLTGLSMGGYGTWAWGIAHPDRFAALVPICGGGNPKEVGAIKDIPTWAFHGGKDNVVPISQTQEMIKALQEKGANPKFTIYPTAGHDSWTEAYNTAELWEWMFGLSKN